MSDESSTGRLLLLPGNRNGLTTGYFHFLFGYLLPVAHWLRSSRVRSVDVRHVGPLDTWFDVVRGHAHLRVLSEPLRGDGAPSEWRNRRTLTLSGWDTSYAFDLRKIGSAVSFLRSQDRRAPPLNSAGITVVARGIPDPWYADHGLTSASQRRSIGNLDEIAAQLSQRGDVELHDAAQLAPVYQVDLFSRTRVLVGQHGAGLANMVWMPPGSVVIEILPPVHCIGHRNRRLFRALAACMGHSYAAVPQADRHAAVDPGAVLSAYDRCPKPRPENVLERLTRQVTGRVIDSAIDLRRSAKQLQPWRRA